MALSVVQVFCLMGALLALQLGVVSLLRRRNRRANVWFSAVVLALGLLLGLASLRFGDVPPADVYPVLHVWGSLALLLGPLVYFYVRASVGSLVWKPWSLLHFLPAAAHLSLLFPLLIGDEASRSALVDRYLEMELYRSLVPGVRIGAVQAAAYWVACFFWVRRLERHISDTASFSDQLHLRWLKSLTGFLLFLLALLALGRLMGADMDAWSVSGLALFLFAVSTFALARPELFGGIPEALLLPDPQMEKPKSEPPVMHDDQQQALAQKLRAHFDAHQLWQQDDLTLGDVSARLKVPRGALSKVINQTWSQSFYDFVNDYRIQAAAALLEDPSQDHISIDGIAVEVGFRSRSVFYTAFKKRKGMTPAAWRKQRG